MMISSCENIIMILPKGDDSMDQSNLQNSMYQTAAMGTEAIRQVMPRVSSKELKSELSRQMLNYHDERSALVSQMHRDRLNPTPLPPAARLMSKAGIALNLMKDPENSHIAEMMIQGTNMGIIKLNRALNGSYGVTPAVARQARSMLDKEQEYIERLKKFL